LESCRLHCATQKGIPDHSTVQYGPHHERDHAIFHHVIRLRRVRGLDPPRSRNRSSLRRTQKGGGWMMPDCTPDMLSLSLSLCPGHSPVCGFPLTPTPYRTGQDRTVLYSPYNASRSAQIMGQGPPWVGCPPAVAHRAHPPGIKNNAHQVQDCLSSTRQAALGSSSSTQVPSDGQPTRREGH
jgi:hypothetical protein